MQKFTFYSPTKVIFGKETEGKAGEEIKRLDGTRVLVHYGSKSAKESGLLERVEKSLKEAGLFYIELGGVKPNPRLGLVREGISLCKKEAIDFILAIGGGSTIDSAKAIAIGVKNPELDIWEDFFVNKAKTGKAIPVASILTISATGSEMSDASVIMNEDGMLKRSIHSDAIRPKFSILNPELTYTLPRYQIACGCVDIMMHTMERYFTQMTGNGMSDHIAMGVLKTIVKYAPVAIQRPDDYEAESEIMWAGSISHNDLTGLGGSSDWGTHQLGHELSGMFDSAHGATLSAMWSSWARFAYKARPERFASFGAELFNTALTGDDEKDAMAAIEKTVEFFKSIDMPVSIKELVGTLPDDKIEELTYKCTYCDTRTIGKFMKLGRKEIYEIYKQANTK